jgi:hypothetical protein
MLQSNTSITTKCFIRTLLLLANTSFERFYYYQMLQSNTSTTTKCLIRTLLLLANTSFKHFYYYQMLQSNTSTTTKCLIRTLLLLANTSFKHFYYYQILTALNKLKIFSHVAHDNSKRFQLFAGFIEQYLVDKISVTNVSSVLVVTI